MHGNRLLHERLLLVPLLGKHLTLETQRLLGILRAFVDLRMVGHRWVGRCYRHSSAGCDGPTVLADNNMQMAREKEKLRYVLFVPVISHDLPRGPPSFASSPHS